MYAPSERSMPRFRAEETPPFSFSKYLKRESLSTYSLQMLAELSG